MAKYRQVQSSFWHDKFVLRLTPEERYFYLYLMTNPRASACGIYELPIQLAEVETGYNRETVEKLMARFIEYGKILYDADNGEVMLTNWIRHNEPKGDATMTCVMKELGAIKTLSFIEAYVSKACEIGYPLQGAYRGPAHPLGEKEKDKEHEKEKEKESVQSIPDGLDLTTWNQWVEYRIQIRKPLKPASILAAQRKLAAFGSDQAAVVEQSIANGWIGLFSLKDHGGNGSSKRKTFDDYHRNLEKKINADGRTVTGSANRVD